MGLIILTVLARAALLGAALVGIILWANAGFPFYTVSFGPKE